MIVSTIAFGTPEMLKSMFSSSITRLNLFALKMQCHDVRQNQFFPLYLTSLPCSTVQLLFLIFRDEQLAQFSRDQTLNFEFGISKFDFNVQCSPPLTYAITSHPLYCLIFFFSFLCFRSGDQCNVLRETEEEGHQRISLFAPLPLRNVVHIPNFIFPQED